MEIQVVKLNSPYGYLTTPEGLRIYNGSVGEIEGELNITKKNNVLFPVYEAFYGNGKTVKVPSHWITIIGEKIRS